MNAVSPQKLAVFDCDGTLVDGQAGICEAMEAACAEADIPVPARNDIRRIVGLSLPQALSHLAPKASKDQRAHAVEAYKQAYRASRTEGRLVEPLYDGMAELLLELHGAGWLLGVATGKSDRGLELCLQQHELAHLFVTLQTADRHPSKPDPAMLIAAMADAEIAPEHTVMIGDTSFDMVMAQNAAVRALGVSWGYHAPDELHAEGAEMVAETIADLRAELLRGVAQ